ncbi:hypothetical protein CRG98_042303 [Punica granatum]|uniref:Uncharacterized protein n=1 Tax=Punica granatum TaxID=22663 RepID=A0A2I0I031_PUNGR|nr:hypothetical protein CRG98_042303 [Punica granatum]
MAQDNKAKARELRRGWGHRQVVTTLASEVVFTKEASDLKKRMLATNQHTQPPSWRRFQISGDITSGYGGRSWRPISAISLSLSISS